MVGDLTLCQKINDADWKRTDMKSASGGLLTSGLGTLLSGLSGGVAQTTVASCIGLFSGNGNDQPQFCDSDWNHDCCSGLFSEACGGFGGDAGAVVGAILLYSACFIVLGGMQLLTSRMLDSRRIFAVGISLLFGLSVDMAPELYRHVPEGLRPLFSSSTALATVLVVSLSLLFRVGIAKRVSFEVVPGEDMEKVRSMLEEQGGAWGMRPEVVDSAVRAVHETVNSALTFNPGLERVKIGIEFNEFKLVADLKYDGVPIQLAESVPSLGSLGTSEGVKLLSTFMIRQFADRVRIKAHKGACRIELTFDH